LTPRFVTANSRRFLDEHRGEDSPWRQLAALNVDVIEAGFPIASRGDLEAVKKVAQEVRTVPIAALARARKEDVSAAIEALKPAASPRLHVFLATSDLHLNVKLKMTASRRSKPSAR